MSEEQIKLDRYAKFRRLGQFREYVVRGGDWKGAQAERDVVGAPDCVCLRSSLSVFV